MKRVLFLLLMVIAAPTTSAAAFVPVPGEHYQILKQTPEGVSAQGVTELFWYGCEHCRQFHYASAMLRQEQTELEWHYLPVVMRPAWRRHAKIHYLLADQPQFVTLHDALYERLAEDPASLDEDDALASWLTGYGVVLEDMAGRLSDFRLNARLKQDQQLIQSLSLRGVPALIIGGRYLMDASMVADMGQYMATLNHLLRLTASEPAESQP